MCHTDEIQRKTFIEKDFNWQFTLYNSEPTILSLDFNINIYLNDCSLCCKNRKSFIK